MAAAIRRKARGVAIGVAVVGLLAPSARADGFFRQLADALVFLGWDIQATQHVLRDGWQLNTVRRFNAETFDFGTHDLFLNGPVVFQVSTAKRFIPTLDIRANTQGSNFRWIYQYNTGIQDALVDGNLTNANLSFNINLLGFYDADLSLTNRGNFAVDGFLVADDGTTDFDIGPLSLSGNIWLDAINMLTNPIGLPTLGSLISGRATKPWNDNGEANVSVGKRWLTQGGEDPVPPADDDDQAPSSDELRQLVVLMVLEQIEQRPVFRLFNVLAEAESPADLDVEALQDAFTDLVASLPIGEFDLASLFVRPVIAPWDELVLPTTELADAQAAQSGSSVPEPVSLFLVAGGLLLARSRRPRRAA